jgi:hypothetical protein
MLSYMGKHALNAIPIPDDRIRFCNLAIYCSDTRLQGISLVSGMSDLIQLLHVLKLNGPHNIPLIDPETP